MAPHRYINRDEDRSGVYYSDAVEAGRTLYVSGCMPEHENAGDTPDAVEAQMVDALAHLRQILDLAGYSVDDLVKLTIYLHDMADARLLAAPRAAALGGARPATTVIGAGSFFRPWMRVEIDAIAIRAEHP